MCHRGSSGSHHVIRAFYGAFFYGFLVRNAYIIAGQKSDFRHTNNLTRGRVFPESGWHAT
jgi:hypothetical protein